MIGQDNKQVLVKHGSEYVRVHISRLIHCDNVDFNPVMKNQNESISTQINSDEQDVQSDDGHNYEVTATTSSTDEVSQSDNVPTTATTGNVCVQNDTDLHVINKQYLPKLK